MTEKNEEKIGKKIADELKDIKLLGKEFRKTTIYGKFMMVATILFILLIVIGTGITVFEAVVNSRNLDRNIYQPIIDLGECCRHNGWDGIFYMALFYTCILPMSMKNNKETDEKKSKKPKENLGTLWLIVFVIIAIGYTLSFIIDVVPIIGRIMAM